MRVPDKNDLFNASLIVMFMVITILAINLTIDAWVACSLGPCSLGQEYVAIMSIILIASIVLGVTFSIAKHGEGEGEE